MTEPRDPGGVDPEDGALEDQTRRGRHWAPDDDNAAAATPSTAALSDADAALDADVEIADDSGVDSAGVGEASDDVQSIEPDPDGPQGENPQVDDVQTAPPIDPIDSPVGTPPSAEHGAAPAVVAAGERRGPRHAASGSGLRLQPWMLAVAAVVVIGLLAWLVIGLTTGEDDAAEETPPATTTSAEATSAAPTPVDPVSLPQVLCMGQSYAMLDTGQSTEQVLADPAAVESQYPGSKLSTIPPGCIAGSDTRDEVVLALGPFPSLADACEAGTATGVAFSAYEGSADTGLEAATCPPA